MFTQAILFLSVFFLICAAAQFLLGVFGRSCSNILNFPLWYFMIFEVPLDYFWVASVAYFCLHAVIYGVYVTVNKTRMESKQEIRHGQTS